MHALPAKYIQQPPAANRVHRVRSKDELGNNWSKHLPIVPHHVPIQLHRGDGFSHTQQVQLDDGHIHIQSLKQSVTFHQCDRFDENTLGIVDW